MYNAFQSKEQFASDLELRFKYDQDPCFPGFHFHDSYEVFYSIGGGMQFIIEDNIYSLNPGDLFVINNHEIHKPLKKPNSKYERIILIIHPDRIKELSPQHSPLLLSCFTSRKRGEHNKINMTDEEREQFFSLVDKIKNLNTYEMGYQALKEMYFIEFLVHLNRWYRTNFSTTDTHEQHGLNPTVKSIIDYLNDNFTTHVSLDQIADEFHLNKYYLCQLFKKTTGTTINHYIVARRLARAKILLYQGYSVSETSAMCGFQNYTHFIRTFKKHCNVSPKQFVKE
jgi:AraC-like DNA-binding protein